MEHDWFCNCSDCWWARGCEERCSCCGCLVSDCPTNNDNTQGDDHES